MTLKLSMCAYQNGEFDLFIIDADTYEEICITGTRTFTPKEIEMFERLMPACVYTKYEQVK